nr:hypothetical protein [Tanacetum cinerariifolium]
MLPGPTAVTVKVRIAPIHTMYPAVAWVALLTEAKANESPIWATEKYVGLTFSPGIVAGEGIPYERSPATFPWRQVAGERNPQRQVAGERPKLSLGKALNVVVLVA